MAATEKFIDIDDEYVLLVQGTVIGEDNDIIFYDMPGISTFNSELFMFKSSLYDGSTTSNVGGYFHIFDLKKYLQDIWNSFKQTELGIIRQLELDYHRQEYFINGVSCPSIVKYFEFINNLGDVGSPSGCGGRWQIVDKGDKDGDHGWHQINILHQYRDILVLMLSTQSSFAYIIEVLQKYYPQLEIIQPRAAVLSSSSSRAVAGRPQICVYTRGLEGGEGRENREARKGIHMEINLWRELFDMKTETTVGKLYCNLYINFDALNLPNLQDTPPLGILSWQVK